MHDSAVQFNMLATSRTMRASGVGALGNSVVGTTAAAMLTAFATPGSLTALFNTWFFDLLWIANASMMFIIFFEEHGSPLRLSSAHSLTVVVSPSNAHSTLSNRTCFVFLLPPTYDIYMFL
jgi:hypothetical protein